MNYSPSRLDWSRCQERLREAQIAIERASTGDEQRMLRAFQQRAHQLAMPRETVVAGNDRLRLLGFRLDDETYGIELCHVVRVHSILPVTPVPGSSPALLGVANFAGNVRSVWGLRELLGLPERDTRVPQYIVLLRYREQQLGLRIEHVETVCEVARHSLVGCNDGDAHLGATLVLGVTPEHRIVLRPDALFDHHLTHHQRAKSCVPHQATTVGGHVELSSLPARDGNF